MKEAIRDFVHQLFSERNSELEIGLFDLWHFLYLFIIFGSAVLLTFLFRSKSERAKEAVVRVFAYLTIGLYVADFLIMPLSDSYSGISTYKLPFNICTIMAVLVPFAQFNKRFKGIKSAIVTLSIASSLMWLCYPGSALGGQPPFSYIIFQTFMYHGFLFIWGVLNLSLGLEKLKISRIWKEFAVILGIFVWAWLGNTIYDGDQNWFFIEESIFPFLKDEIMPIMVIASVFGVCLVIYGVYYLVKVIYHRVALLKERKKEQASTKVVEKLPENYVGSQSEAIKSK